MRAALNRGGSLLKLVSMKMKNLVYSLLLCVVFSSCDVMKQVGGAYTMTQCKYDYKSISNLTLSGMDLSKGVSLAYIPKVVALLSGQSNSIPLGFNLNLDVSNPNMTEALLNGLQYVLSIDGVQFTTGSVSQTLAIPSGGNSVLPLNIGVDLATLLKGESKDAVVNIVKNFIGMGDKKSNVSLQIRPTFMINGQAVTSPVFIPVSFAFGGA